MVGSFAAILRLVDIISLTAQLWKGYNRIGTGAADGIDIGDHPALILFVQDISHPVDKILFLGIFLIAGHPVMSEIPGLFSLYRSFRIAALICLFKYYIFELRLHPQLSLTQSRHMVIKLPGMFLGSNLLQGVHVLFLVALNQKMIVAPDKVFDLHGIVLMVTAGN